MSKPTCRELIVSVRHAFDRESVVAGQEVDLAARVERVLALHRPIKQKHGGPDYCAACILPYPKIELWPCPTVRLLDGEEL